VLHHPWLEHAAEAADDGDDDDGGDENRNVCVPGGAACLSPKAAGVLRVDHRLYRPPDEHDVPVQPHDLAPGAV